MLANSKSNSNYFRDAVSLALNLQVVQLCNKYRYRVKNLLSHCLLSPKSAIDTCTCSLGWADLGLFASFEIQQVALEKVRSKKITGTRYF